ncbi:hypothetical protein RFM99_26100 [Mesorhizobium sp. VK4C]|nr:hypothetical protein [Mesorhizobium sp. VK4C]MDX8501873.1 hypothetical protein [Mesorhizobium sp. VK4C]
MHRPSAHMATQGSRLSSAGAMPAATSHVEGKAGDGDGHAASDQATAPA